MISNKLKTILVLDKVIEELGLVGVGKLFGWKILVWYHSNFLHPILAKQYCDYIQENNFH